MWTTLVNLLSDPACRSFAWGHIGDSWLCLLRGGVLHLRTRDHRLVQSMVNSRLIQPEEVRSHSESNFLFALIGG